MMAPAARDAPGRRGGDAAARFPAVPVPRIHIVVASTRQGRRGGWVGAWFAAIAHARDDLSAEVVDLLAWDLPWYRGPDVPARAVHRDEATMRWAAKVAEADGYVLVCPEYNHGYPAPMKNALDLVYAEWSHKPVTFVTYGGSAGGVRASEQLVQVAVELKMAPLRAQVHIPMVGRVFGRDGSGEPEPRHAVQAGIVLDELVWWARALRAARDQGVPAERRA
jgi:NAD(P)H-dependent FMN reductase